MEASQASGWLGQYQLTAVNPIFASDGRTVDKRTATVLFKVYHFA